MICRGVLFFCVRSARIALRPGVLCREVRESEGERMQQEDGEVGSFRARRRGEKIGKEQRASRRELGRSKRKEKNEKKGRRRREGKTELTSRFVKSSSSEGDISANKSEL